MVYPIATVHRIRVLFLTSLLHLSFIVPGTNIGPGFKAVAAHKGVSLETINTYYETYDVALDVKILSYETWATILHVTNDNLDTIGGRIPMIMVNGDNKKFQMCSTANDDHNVCYEEPITLGKWTHINVRQKLVGGKYMVQWYVDRVLKHELENTKPQKFEKINVYFAKYANSNLADCQMNNLKITTPMKNGLIGKHEMHIVM